MEICRLAVDPNGWRINACSFQQDALVSHNQYQYVVLYQPLDESDPSGPRVTSIGRRSLHSDSWLFIVFEDYVQTKDDGHNVISMGISGDGVIHLAWDMHGDSIHYRQSEVGLACCGSQQEWLASSFGPVLSSLDCGEQAFLFDEITYPRFQRVENGDLLMEFRSGRSGLGDCYIYRYSCKSRVWKEVGMYIRGLANNAYLHGLDYFEGRLHVSWTYRDFVEDRAVYSGGTLQAGPNGPENNHDLHYMYSDDAGKSWYNTWNEKVPVPVDIHQNTLAAEIPKNSGIMNQEGQCVGHAGQVHVLGRENNRFFHYFREESGNWSKEQVEEYAAPLFGARGKIVERNGFVYVLLPLQNHRFVILRKKPGSGRDWAVVHQLEGFDGEPLVDRSAAGLYVLQREGDSRRGIGGAAEQSSYRWTVVLGIPIV